MTTPPWAAGNAAVKAGRLPEALAEYTRFLAAGGGSATEKATVLSNRAQVYLQLHLPAQALADAEAALAADPTQPKALFRKVTALAQLGRQAEAEAAAAAAQQTSLSPEDKRRIQAAAQQAAKPGSGSSSGSGAQHVSISAEEGRGDRRVPDSSWLPAEMREHSVFVPSKDGRIENILLMLHGLGDSPGNYARLARKMALPGTLCLALAAPLRLPPELAIDGGMWYQIHNLAPDQGLAGELASYKRTLGLLCRLLRALHEQYGWPFSRLHLFGFSQGGGVALGVASQFRGRDKLGGCISVAGAYPYPEHASPASKKASPGGPEAGGTPVLMTHGDRDDQVPKEAMLKSVGALKACGCPTRLCCIPGKGHAMVGSEQEMRLLMEFWAQTLKAAAPAGAAGEQYVEVQQ